MQLPKPEMNRTEERKNSSLASSSHTTNDQSSETPGSSQARRDAQIIELAIAVVSEKDIHGWGREETWVSFCLSVGWGGSEP